MSGLKVLAVGIAYQDSHLQREWLLSNAKTLEFSRFLIALWNQLRPSKQPRQRGLRRPVLRQGRRPARVAAGQLPKPVTAQLVGIAEIDPTHGTLQHQSTQLTGQ